MTTETINSTDFAAQRSYVEQLKAAHFDFGVTIADAFIRGMRQIGYKSTATALNELIDNAIQAEAAHIAILWPQDEKKPSAIAVADDGHGMEPDMTRVSVIWGGTHRENDGRAGFGRFGYGLPSASVSQGRRFTVYSKVAGGDWYSVTVDIDEITAGKYTDPATGKIVVPEAAKTKLPTWVESQIKEQFGSFDHGTVVVIEKLDQLSWKTASKLREELLAKCGVTYRNYIRSHRIVVDGQEVEPTDPLFLTPGFRYFDSYMAEGKLVHDPDRAEALPPLAFEVKDDAGRSLGEVKVRFASIPPTFARVPESKHRTRGRNNPRFAILDENNGLIVLRHGRQIDVINSKRPLFFFNNDDRYVKVEIDFPATLDEEFSIGTTKQQVGLSDRMWELLTKHGLMAAIVAMRKKYDEATAKLKAAPEEDKDGKRPSEEAMEQASKFKTRAPSEPAQQQKEAEEGFQRELERRSEVAGVSKDIIEPQLRTELTTRKYRVAEESMTGAPFYRVEQMGGQKVLYLNTAHRFYRDVYAGPDSTPRLRYALEVVLFVLGESELEATQERRKFYESERAHWSTQLNTALDDLNDIVGLNEVSNAAKAEAEAEEVAVAAKA